MSRKTHGVAVCGRLATDSEPSGPFGEPLQAGTASAPTGSGYLGETDLSRVDTDDQHAGGARA